MGALLLTLAAVWVVETAQQARFERERRAEVLSRLSATRSRLETALNARLYLGHALAAYVHTNPTIGHLEYVTLAQGLLAGQPGVFQLYLVRGTTVRNVFPMEPPAPLLGVDLLTSAEHRDAVWRAQDGWQPSLGGPFVGPMDREVLIGRLPIVLQSTAEPRFWGMALVVIDRDHLLREAALASEGDGLSWALRGRDGWGALGQPFFGDPVVFDSQPETLDVTLPTGTWQLAAVPQGGWATLAPAAWWIRIGGGAFGLLFATLVYWLVRDPVRLREAVDEATVALREQQDTLEQRVRERTNELSTLLEVSRAVASRLETDSVVEVILEQLRVVLDYTGVRVWRVEGEDLVLLADRGPQSVASQKGYRVPLSSRLVISQACRERRPIVVSDTRADEPLAERLRSSMSGIGDPTLAYIASIVVVPMVVRDRVVGILNAVHEQPGYFTQRHADLAFAFANQAGIAIENAHLYEEAQDRAAHEERQRLARDLHDAVTQTLFSASVIAEALPSIWRKSPERALRRAEELRVLARGALAEMRMLLLELRPGVLTEVALSQLVRQLGEAFTGKTRVPVDLAVEGDAKLPPDVQVAFYRVAQEALNNAAKHAQPSRVAVTLRQSDGRVALVVRDDGRGFDPSAVPAGHLGVGIMRERAESVGGAVRVESRPGGGTEVVAEWSAP